MTVDPRDTDSHRQAVRAMLVMAVPLVGCWLAQVDIPAGEAEEHSR